jgi:sugar phosphate isomerase/epimerase
VRATRDAWRGLAAIAAEHGIRFVLELHHRTITPGASSALRVLDGCDPAHVGVIYDVANTAIEGNEPMPLAIDLLGPYLAHVHIKDVAWQPAASWNGQDATFVPLGEGAMRWELCLAALRNAGYAGWLAIENFTELARGPERIAGDLAWLRARTQEAGHVG